MLGEVFTSRDEVSGSDRVVVVSHGFWQRHVRPRSSAIGRTLALDGESYAIVGVMPAGFALSTRARPASRHLDALGPGSAGTRARRRRSSLIWILQSIARLQPGVSSSRHRPRCPRSRQTIAAANPATNTGPRDRRPSAARSPRRELHAVVDAHAPCRGRHRAAHRVRECRQPLAGTSLRAAARCGRACGTRRQSRSTCTARADREPRRVGRGDHRWSRVCLAVRSRAGGRVAREPRARGRDRHRCARAVGRGGRRVGDGTRLGHRSCAAGIQSRALNRAQRERPRRWHEPRPSSRPCGARRRRSRARRRPARRRGALHRQLRQRDARRSRLPERPRVDRANRGANASRIGGDRPAAGVRRGRRSRAAAARRGRRRVRRHRGFRCASTCGSMRCGRRASRPTPT